MRLFPGAVALVAAIALGGCAGHVLYKPGATQAMFDADKSACEYEALKYAGGFDNSYRSSFGSSLDMALRRNEITNACMGQKGWAAVRGGQTPQGGVTAPSAPIPDRQDIPL